MVVHLERNMTHRHINSGKELSSAAIDDIIGRGSLADWGELKRAARLDARVLDRIIRVCAPRLADPYEQRYHLWNYHARHAHT